MNSEINSKSGAVTFIDVLGWKGIWATQGSIKPIEKLQKIRDNVSSSFQAIISKLSDHKEMSGFNTDGIKLLNISDSLIVLTDGDPTANLLVHGEICSEIIVQGIKNGLAMRGATSFGDFSYAENIFLGPAIDEAASWHELTNWIGVTLTPSALLKVNHQALGKWKPYEETPYKYGDFKIKNSIVLDWTQTWKASGSDLQALNEFCSSKSPLLPEVSKYYLNTLEFYNKSIATSLLFIILFITSCTNNSKTNSQTSELSAQIVDLQRDNLKLTELNQKYQKNLRDTYEKAITVERIERDSLKLKVVLLEKKLTESELEIKRLTDESLNYSSFEELYLKAGGNPTELECLSEEIKQKQRRFDATNLCYVQLPKPPEISDEN